MKKQATILTLLLVAGSVLAAKGPETRLEGRLTADFNLGDISGKAKYREKEGRARFSVEVEGLTSGDVFDVLISGQVVGRVTIGLNGVGDLNYDTNFEPGFDDPTTKFPANFPGLDGGERIEVGSLSGTLQNH